MNVSQCQESEAVTIHDVRIDIQRSPVPHLLTSNNPPTPSEACAIKDFLSDARRTRGAIEAEIERNDEALNHLRAKQDALQISIHQHESLLSPIRRVPQDILRQIFYLCLPIPSKISSFDNTIAPLLLTRVCKPWTQCAIASQQLWANFTITSGSAPPGSLARTWISHANSIPLFPQIIFTGTSIEARRAWPAVAQAIQYCDRWETLSVTAPENMLHRFKSIRGRLHQLKVLSITLPPGYRYNHKTDVFDSAPQLHKVVINNLHLQQVPQLP